MIQYKKENTPELGVTTYLYKQCQVTEYEHGYHVTTFSGGHTFLDKNQIQLLPSVYGDLVLQEGIYGGVQSYKVIDRTYHACLPLFLSKEKYNLYEVYRLTVSEKNPRLEKILVTSQIWALSLRTGNHKMYYFEEAENGILYLNGALLDGSLQERHALFNVYDYQPEGQAPLVKEGHSYIVMANYIEDFRYDAMELDTVTHEKIREYFQYHDKAIDEFLEVSKGMFGSEYTRVQITWLSEQDETSHVMCDLLLRWDNNRGCFIQDETIQTYYRGAIIQYKPDLIIAPQYILNAYAPTPSEDAPLTIEDVVVNEEEIEEATLVSEEENNEEDKETKEEMKDETEDHQCETM